MKTTAASLALALCAITQAQPARSIRPAPATPPIAIDGRLDEPAWTQAQDSGAFVWLSDRAPQGAKAPTRTTFKLLTATDAVYFGVTCAEPSMATLQDAPVERDGLVFKRDCLEFFLAPEGNADNCYQFALSAGNAQWDMYFIEGGQTTIGDYSALWESAVHKDKDFWSAELRIPLTAFVHTPTARFSDTWLLNVARERQLPGGGREYLTWAPLRTALRDIPNFIKVSGMPRKTPKDDIGVTSITVSVQSRAADSYVGEAVVATRASAEAAGRYLVSLNAGDRVLVPPQPALIRAGESTTRFRDVRFAQLGKTELKAVLAAADQRPVAGSYASVRLDYAPLVVRLDTPFYRNAFYPGQDASRVAGAAQVNLDPNSLAGARLNVSILRDAKPLRTAAFEVKGQRVPFEMTGLDLPEGAFVLRCAIAAAGRELASLDTPLTRLSPPAQGVCVYVDPSLNLVVNGKPRFQRGWFGGPSGVFSQAIIDQYGPNAMMEHSHGVGAYVWLHAERFDPAEKERCRLDVKPSDKVFEVMRKTIEDARGNPNILYYYLADEPECRHLSPVYLKHQYDFARQLDPYRPVMIVTRDPARYTSCADILNPHSYLSPFVDPSGRRRLNNSPLLIRSHIRAVLEAGEGRIAAWHTPQVFSYGSVNSQADHPSFDEHALAVFAAVASGAKGITPFTYRSLFSSFDLRIGMPYVYEVLEGLEHFLISSQPALPVSVQSPEDGVQVLLRQDGDQILLIAVNLLDQPTQAVIESSGLGAVSNLHAHRAPGQIRVAGGRLNLDLAPYAVAIYTRPALPLAPGQKTFAQVRAEIAAAKAALTQPGNILAGRGKEIEWTASDNYVPPKTLPTLADGYRDVLGWKDVRGRGKPAWIEAAFPTFTPKFRSAHIYSATVEDLDFLIWKRGEWKKIAEARGAKGPLIKLDLPEPVTTVKLRIEMPKTRQGMTAEVYEIELFE